MRTVTVHFDGSGDYTSISEAVDKALPYDIIEVGKGVFLESIIVDKPIKIKGTEKIEDSVIVLSGEIGIVSTSDIEIEGVVLSGLSEETNILINSKGRLSIKHCVLCNCSTGIQIDSPKSRVMLQNSSIRDCGDGLRFANSSSGLLDGVEFQRNKSSIVITSGSNVLVTNCKFTSNQVGSDVTSLGECVIQESFFNNNGVAVNVSEGGNPIIRRCNFDANERGLVFGFTGFGFVEDCVLNSCGIGVSVSDSSSPILRNFSINQCIEYGMKFFGNVNCFCQSGIISDCRVGVFLEQKANPLLRQIKIVKSQKQGLLVDSESRGVLDECEISFSKNAGILVRSNSSPTIRNSKIIGNASSGCYITKQSGAYLIDCEIAENEIGVLVDGRSWFEIVRSKIRHSIKHGVMLINKIHGLIESSFICNNLGSGLKVIDESQPFIRNSNINRNSGYGIILKRASKVFVTGTYITGNMQEALHFDSDSEVVSVNNEIANTQPIGII